MAKTISRFQMGKVTNAVTQTCDVGYTLVNESQLHMSSGCRSHLLALVMVRTILLQNGISAGAI